MAEIVERLCRAKDQIGNVSSVLLDVVNAGDQISSVLNIGYRPALFQDLRDKWVSVSDMESAIGSGIAAIEQRDQIIAEFLKAAEPFVALADILPSHGLVARVRIADGVDASVTGKDLRALSEAASKARENL